MTQLKDRFEGSENRRVLVDSLRRQILLRELSTAEAFADRGELIELAKGDVLIEQGKWDTDLYFILAGGFDVIINGQRQNTRTAGEHVGELAGLSGARSRTATLVAVSESIVLKIDQATLNTLVGDDADFWKSAADVVADRLDQRNLEIGKANECPRIFVISSSEGLAVGRQIRKELSSDSIHVYLWDKGTFGISEYPISDLEDAIESADFTVSVVRPDDNLVSRGTTSTVARDNVHLEFGLSLGKLGRVRSALLVDAQPGLKLPSDLAGLTTLRYQGKTTSDMERTVAVACDTFRSHIERYGVRQDRRLRA